MKGMTRLLISAALVWGGFIGLASADSENWFLEENACMAKDDGCVEVHLSWWNTSDGMDLQNRYELVQEFGEEGGTEVIAAVNEIYKLSQKLQTGLSYLRVVKQPDFTIAGAELADIEKSGKTTQMMVAHIPYKNDGRVRICKDKRFVVTLEEGFCDELKDIMQEELFAKEYAAYVEAEKKRRNQLDPTIDYGHMGAHSPDPYIQN